MQQRQYCNTEVLVLYQYLVPDIHQNFHLLNDNWNFDIENIFCIVCIYNDNMIYIYNIVR